jgi:hypothetical protein
MVTANHLLRLFQIVDVAHRCHVAFDRPRQHYDHRQHRFVLPVHDGFNQDTMYPRFTTCTNIASRASQVFPTRSLLIKSFGHVTSRNIDHGLVYGWNQTSHCVPIKSKVHPENFTVKGWGLLHHAGFLSYPHHDAEGTLTWVRMEVGVKFWAVFRPKRYQDNRIHLQEFATKLVDFTSHKEWVQKHCDGEVIVLRPGDMLYVND